jgi:tetratricopeptide (TPR) repeat protein
MVIAALVAGAAYWQRALSRTRRIEVARSSIETNEGFALLEHLASQYPNDPEVLLLRTRALRMRNQLAAAQQALDRAGQLGSSESLGRERMLLLARTDFSRADPELQVALDRDPQDREVLLALAIGWTQLKSYKKAESLANALLERDPDHGFALCLAGRLQLLQHMPFAAKPFLEKAYHGGSGRYYYADARIMLAQCLLEAGAFPESLHLYEECRADEPNDAKILLGIGRCQWFLGKWQEATETFETLLRLNPDHLDALSQLAYVREEHGEKEKALELLERAARQDPTWDELHFRMAKILLALGRKDRAKESLAHAEDLKKHWAKPRTRSAGARSSYTGEDASPERQRSDN